MKSAMRILCCISAMLVFTSLPVCYGQTTAGMAGDVSDASGASVPNVIVTLVNKTTGAKFATTSSGIGFYRFSEIPPGQGYEAVFAAKGFATLTIKDIYLTVNNVRTQNAALQVSAREEQVEVTASNSEVTIDTTSPAIGNTFDVAALNNLPVQQRNDPLALFQMQPGVTDSGAVTGARVDQNYVTLDGMDVNDIATGGATQNGTAGGVFSSVGTIVGHAPVDSVEEFHGNVAGADASTGPGGGGQFALVTKSGTNSFHGNLNEYHRDEDLVANSWFSNNSNPIVPRNHLIQNQFGGNIGGPIKRDKLFFFFDYGNSKIIEDTLVQRTVPLNTFRGDYTGGAMVGYISNTGAIKYLNAAQIKALDPAGVGFDSSWVSNYTTRFPKSNNSITGDGVNSGGLNFNSPTPDDETNYVGRGDYNINDNMKLFARFSISRENYTYFPNEFAGDPSSEPGVDRSYAFVIGHTWVIGGNRTNRIVLGETVQKLSFPDDYNPDGTTFLTFGDGTGPSLTSSEYLQPDTQARRVPIPMIGDDFSWTKGSHTFQWGGTFKDILAHDTTVADYNTVEFGMGGYILNLCGPTPGDCGAGNPSLRPSDINTSALLGNQASYDYDQAFTFTLARLGEISSDYNYNAKGQALKQLTGDQRFYRYYQTQMYLSDSWKMTPSLTATYGLTYQWFTVPYEIHGLESVEPYTFNQYMQARVQQSSLGQTGADAVPLIAYYLGGKANGSAGLPLYSPEYKNFAPHVGFVWNPGFDKKTVFNAGGGVVYDRTVINAIQHLQDAYSYLFQQTSPTPEGISGDPYDSVKTDPRLDSSGGLSNAHLTPPATPSAPYEPFVAGGVPYGLIIGSAFNSATIDPALKTPYSIAFNAGFQRSMPWDTVLKVNYVGRLGRRLVAQADANQVLDFPDSVSGQLLSQAMASVTTQLRAGATSATIKPQPWFENVIGAPPGWNSYTQFLVANFGPFMYRGDFGDAVQFFADTGAPFNVGSAAQFSENSFVTNDASSNYHGLLLTVSKNMSHGLQYDFNYTWSHSIDDYSFYANSQGDTGVGGIGLICDVIRPRECRADSDFDLRHVINSDVTYQLPFGKGKMFAGTAPFVLNEFIGGWSLSAVTSWHTGYPWSTISNAFVASYSNDAPARLIGSKSAVATHVTYKKGGGVSIFANQANAVSAFQGPVGFQIGPRNELASPRYFNADAGLAKTFPITAERVNVRFRADAFNVLNHPNFQAPSNNSFNGLDESDITNASFGQISYTVSPAGNLNNGARVLELSLRLEF